MHSDGVDESHVFRGAYGQPDWGERLDGSTVLWCRQCLQWIDERDTQSVCDGPHEPCQGCVR